MKGQMLLGIMFLIICTCTTWPLKRVIGSAFENWIWKYLEIDKEFLMTCRTKHVWNQVASILISGKGADPKIMGWKSLWNISNISFELPIFRKKLRKGNCSTRRSQYYHVSI